MIGGEIIVMPDKGKIAFLDRRMSRPQLYGDPEDVLRVLNTYGWGEPSHFDEITGSLKEFKQIMESGISSDYALETIVEGWERLDRPDSEAERKVKKLLDF